MPVFFVLDIFVGTCPGECPTITGNAMESGYTGKLFSLSPFSFLFFFVNFSRGDGEKDPRFLPCAH